MDITINKKKITLKYSLRAMLMYENITGGTLKPSNLSDVITFYYCVVLASSMDFSLSFENFLNWLDENPESISEFGLWLQNISFNNNKLKKD